MNILRMDKRAVSVAKWFIIFTSPWLAGLVRANPIVATGGVAVTVQNKSVTIPVLTNVTDAASNQLAVLQLSAPAHGTVVINSNLPVTTAELSRLFQFAGIQLSNTVAQMPNTNTYPRSTASNGTWTTMTSSDWTCGFFPGCLWYLYQETGDTNYEKWAQQWTAGIATQEFVTNTDDIGFMFNTSFGNGYRLTGSSSYESVLVQAAHSLTNRFNATVGCLADDRLLGPPEFEVIMDTTMNTELLYHVADINGDTTLSAKAMSHAQRMMTNQIRPDTSTFHLVLYNTVNGALLYQGTRAGYSATSTWARAHSWSIYGLTMAYRETGYLPFLSAVRQVADFYLTNVPSDYVPYWDYDAPNLPNAPRDSSSAAIALSALVQLSQLTTNMQDSATFWAGAHNILESLGSSNYLAQGTTSSGVLLHGTGNPPQIGDPEVNVSLIYGDYYFIEALVRYTQAYGRTNITYTPSPGFTGTDAFTYQVCDSGGNCSTATVTVDVLNTNPVLTFNAQAAFSPTNHQPAISFPAVSNYLYEVDYTSSLTPPQQWSVLASNLAGSDSVISVNDTNPTLPRFYRVKAN
jgi:unsaturated chondroitin disaccharide hydrolase